MGVGCVEVALVDEGAVDEGEVEDGAVEYCAVECCCVCQAAVECCGVLFVAANDWCEVVEGEVDCAVSDVAVDLGAVEADAVLDGAEW